MYIIQIDAAQRDALMQALINFKQPTENHDYIACMLCSDLSALTPLEYTRDGVTHVGTGLNHYTLSESQRVVLLGSLRADAEAVRVQNGCDDKNENDEWVQHPLEYMIGMIDDLPAQLRENGPDCVNGLCL